MKYIKYFEDNIPGDAPITNQLHVFDFDDTLGVTKNANGVMLYANGVPAHKTSEEVLKWLSEYGLSKADLIPGPDGETIQFFDNLGGCAAYVDSAKLAVLTKSPDFVEKDRRYSTDRGLPPASIDKALYIDFTPSGFVDLETTKPIKDVIKKLTDTEEEGADTMVLTARAGTGEGKNFKGETVPVTNKKDIEEFLNKNDDDPSSKPVDLVMGVTGGDKGEILHNRLHVLSKEDFERKAKGFPIAIRNILKRRAKKYPEEIHFYDDADQNTDAVVASLGGKVPAEVYIYGPGEFDKGHATPNKPTKSFQSSSSPSVKKNKLKKDFWR